MNARSDFWSRRRAAVAAEDRAERRSRDELDAAARDAELAERPEDEILAELGLPEPESVCSGEDVQRFMAKAVPDYLRRRALRALWRSNPVLACLDGLNDYDGDFTNAATDAPAVQTAYRVGKGLQAHLDALARQADVADASDDVSDDADAMPEVEPPADDEADSDVIVAERDAGTDAARPEGAFEGAATEDAPAEAPRPRRMAFRFDGKGAA